MGIIYARNVAPSSERWTLKAWGSRRREAWGSWGTPPPQPTRGSGERRELPQRGPGRSPGRQRQRIIGIFQGLRILLVETMHYGNNQKFGGHGQDLGGLCPPGPSLKPPLFRTIAMRIRAVATGSSGWSRMPYTTATRGPVHSIVQ